MSQTRQGATVVAFALMLALMVAAGSSAEAGLATAPASLRVDVAATRSGDTITYNITLVNTSSDRIGNIFVAGMVPQGAKFVKATATPAKSWFRGFEGAGSPLQAAVWLSEGIAPNGQQGPFSYQVNVAGTLAPAHAWVRWLSPSEGQATSSQVTVSQAVATGYVGSEACAKCHAANYSDFRVSGHPWKLREAEEAMANPIPLPAGVTWDDVSYVVGGYKWKARFMDKQGYIITSPGGQPGKNQYNLATGKWSDYEPGTTKKYDCGNCHNTGYSTEGNQGGLPGIVGTWVFNGVQCEACHGPGASHAASGSKAAIKVDRTSAACSGCHTRGTADQIPAAGGFVRHQEQNNELVISPHKSQSCTNCHNPHKKAEFSIKLDCSSCHSGVQQAFAGSKMQKVGVTCVDCHMPKAMKSAINVSKNEADVRSHLFRINTDPKANMFTDDGAFAKDFLTLNFSCLGCHEDKDVNWAAANAKGIHSRGN